MKLPTEEEMDNWSEGKKISVMVIVMLMFLLVATAFINGLILILQGILWLVEISV